MGKIYIRRISVVGLCLLMLYIGMLLYSKFGQDAFLICLPLIMMWLFTYDLVIFKHKKLDDKRINVSKGSRRYVEKSLRNRHN